MDFLHIPDIDTELTLEILNTLDSFLDHNDGNVMLSVASLFMKLVSSNKSLQSSLVKRIVPVFVRYFTTKWNILWYKNIVDRFHRGYTLPFDIILISYARIIICVWFILVQKYC